MQRCKEANGNDWPTAKAGVTNLTFIAGAYVGTFNAVNLGITEQGFEVQQDSKAEMIEESDAYGQSLIDWVK